MKPVVLVADDNQLNRLLLLSILKKAHLSVDFAKDGSEACNLLKKRHYDILLLDHNMPVLNGVGVAKFILDHLEEKTRPVTIGISGIGMDLNKSPYKELGIKDFIIKPITMEKVFKVLESYLPKFILPQFRSDNKIKKFSQEFKFINGDEIIENYLGDPVLIGKLASSFLDNYIDCIKRMENILEEGNWEEINFYSHSIFNSFSQMCFVKIQVIKAIDHAAFERDKESLMENFTLIKDDIAGFMEEIKNLISFL